MKAKLAILILAALLVSCAPATTPTEEPQSGAIYINNADLLIMESYPVQVMLHITGDLPTPCHTFHYAYQIGNESDRFRIEINGWSEADPAAMCAQVLQPFEENVSIPMAGAADGAYSVYLNGDFVGRFNYPG